MMNYKLVPNAPNGGYNILETTTGQIVVEGKDEAKQLCRHLNMGGGFDGSTPSFFLTRLPTVEYN
jgi:hypothetical protein